MTTGVSRVEVKPGGRVNALIKSSTAPKGPAGEPTPQPSSAAPPQPAPGAAGKPLPLGLGGGR
jgi:hypothetical protein